MIEWNCCLIDNIGKWHLNAACGRHLMNKLKSLIKQSTALQVGRRELGTKGLNQGVMVPAEHIGNCKTNKSDDG